MSDLFYVFGGALTLMALLLSFVGLRSEGFPKSRGLLLGGVALMATLVVGSTAFAVVLAREEADHREHELAEAEAEAAEQASEQAAESGGEDGAEPVESEPADAQVLELSSPQDGALEYEPDSLSASVGQVTLSYTNPSVVPHDVAIEADGETIGQGPTVTNGDTSEASAAVEAGEYVFYCTVPGHREAGMEGTLTVK